MPKISIFLQSAYANAYDLKIKPNYSSPKIYNAGGDLTKRWYVYYSFKNPDTGKMERQDPIYADVNRLFKTFSTRTKAINTLRDAVEDILKAGFNPMAEKIDFSKIFENLKIINPGMALHPENISDAENSEKTPLVADAVVYALKIWKSTLAENTYPDYKGRINQFEKWLTEHNYQNQDISKIRKRTVVNYLNEVLSRTSPKNRNNSRAVLSAFFGLLKEDEYIDSNFVADIKVLSATPKKNKTYTPTQERQILNHLFHNDKILDLFIKFVSYNFLRPVEASRLRVMDIDVIGKKMRFKAKNQPIKTKIIPDILLKELPDLKNLNPSNFFFTPEGFGLDWDTAETNRRNYFGKRFKKVKEKFGLGEEYGLYSWRHTYITKLYYEFVRESTPFEAKSKLMLITGHSTMLALEKYLRDIDAVLPDDYSAALIKANEWLVSNPLPEAT